MNTALHIGEPEFRQMADVDVVGIYCYDTRGNIIEANDAFCGLVGRSRQDLRSGDINCADLSAPEFRAADIRAIDELQKTGNTTPYEKEFVRPDGSRVSVLAGGAFLAEAGKYGVGFAVDLSGRRQAVRQSPDEIRNMIAEAADDAIFILNEKGVVAYANPSVQKTFGYLPQELLGQDLKVVMPEHATAIVATSSQLSGPSLRGGVETTGIDKYGRKILLEVSPGRFELAGKHFSTWIMRDVTERKKVETLWIGQNRLLEMVALGAPLEEVLEELVLLIESVSPDMLGSVLLLGDDGRHVVHGAAPHLPPAYAQAINGSPIGPSAGSCGTAMYKRERVIVTDIRRDPLWAGYRELAIRHGLLACWSTPICSSQGNVLGSFAMYYHEVRSPGPADLELAGKASHIASVAIERKVNEERIRHMAHHDALTGLPNRVLLEESLELAIAHARRQRGLVALLFIDLDNFKGVNDTLGHHVGDLLLQAAAQRLQGCVRADDILARLGGDEFVIILTELRHSEEAALVARKALKALDVRFDVGGHELHTSGSIGISMFPGDGQHAETLMREADTAMYHAKESGRGNFRFFTQELNAAVQQRLSIENQLRQALAQDELMLHYQPQVDMQSARIFSAEALLRWRHAERGVILPQQFIPVAEETGLILQIGEWVLRQACAQLEQWRASANANMEVAVNLSARQIFQPGFVDLVARILREFNIPPASLQLEITETILMQPSDKNIDTLTRLSEMGIQLAVDDFGIGYSSLSYLKRFPIHALKIDRSFINGIGTSRDDMAITNAIIGMANGLHLNVIAEGVETAEQASFLKAAGCMSAQGYYYSMPMGAQVLTELLQGANV